MRKSIVILFVLALTGVFVVSCGNEKKENATEKQEMVKEDDHSDHAAEAEGDAHSEGMAHSAYQCPMKCEKEKTYTEAGSCPVCKMDLKETEIAQEEKSTEETSSEETSTEG